MAPTVNRKKQKRRQKQAARLAAEQQGQNGDISTDPTELDGQSRHSSRDQADSDADDGEMYDPDEDDDKSVNASIAMNGNGVHDPHINAKELNPGKKKNPKKERPGSHPLGNEGAIPTSTASATLSRPPIPPLAVSSPLPDHKAPKERIWNTSTQEERENIKKFWLELGEDDRRALVKVEKDAVLKKMKEQQKHSCSCTVCGRKRTAIEEELEVLYDAYYEELEQYANNNQGAFENGAPIVPPPRLYQPRLHSLDHHTHLHHHHHPSHGRVHELPDDEEELEDDYDEDDEDEPYSDDDLEDEASRNARADFFAFGNSLTVKGILRDDKY
jgi:hypothetical protein